MVKFVSVQLLRVIIFLLTYGSLSAQNLVPNPGFDINNGCPNQINQVNKAVGWDGWGGTPDYFHSCSNISNPIFGTPFNNRGFQVPHSGDAYIGIFSFTAFTTNGREFVGCQLDAPLVTGQLYYISLWVNHADTIVVSHSTDKIGIRFSTVAHSLVNPDTALNNAHVFSTVVITDTANWVQVTGSFIADSAYTHVGIGNYFSDANTVVVPGASNSNYAYYLIDDVCVSSDPSVCGIETGLNPDGESYPGVYPNPAAEFVVVQSQKGFDGTLDIINLSGQIVVTQKISISANENKSVDIKEIVPGIYFLIFKDENGTNASKLIKK